MTTSQSCNTRNQSDNLAEVLGATPPKGLDVLSVNERDRLAQLITAALDRHEAAIDEAEEGVLLHIPRPLRGAVRKLLLGGR